MAVGWGGPRAAISCLSLLGVSLLGCSPPPEPVTEATPPLGEWQLTAIDGEIEILQGGGAVICRQGSVLSRPAPLYDEESPNLSSLRLEPDRFVFSIAFVEGSYTHQFTNEGYGGSSFQGRWFESLSELRIEDRWSWKSGLSQPTVRGAVTTGSTPRDWRPRLESKPTASTEALDDPWITFEMNGRFTSATELEGEWEYHERTHLGGCWSQGEGKGTWVARAPETMPSAPTEVSTMLSPRTLDPEPAP